MRWLLVLAVLFLSAPASASAQFPDKIVVESGPERDLLPYDFMKTPLFQAMEKDQELGRRALMLFMANGQPCTALYRGYFATWQILHGQLYLTRLRKSPCTETEATDINLNELFPGTSGPLPAVWFTGDLVIGEGPPVGNSGNRFVYASYLIIQIEAGRATKMGRSGPAK